jgi:hypothetical protein
VRGKVSRRAQKERESRQDRVAYATASLAVDLRWTTSYIAWRRVAICAQDHSRKEKGLVDGVAYGRVLALAERPRQKPLAWCWCDFGAGIYETES